MALAAASPGPGELRVLAIVGEAVHGGATTQLIERLPLLAQRRVALSAVVPRANWVADAMSDAGVEVAVTPFDADPGWPAVRATAAIVEARNVDVLYAHHTPGHALGAIVSAVTGRRCLASVDQSEINMLELEAHRLHDDMHLGVTTEAAALHALTLGVRRERLHRIPHGIDGEATREAVGTLHDLAGLPRETNLVGWIGRVVDDERPAWFVRAAAHALRRRDDLAFVMIGDGARRNDIDAMIRSQSLSERVRWLSARRDFARLAGDLGCLVLTAGNAGMPVTALQAMSAGVPVVATATGGHGELVRHGDTGVVVADDPTALANAIVELFDDPARRSAMSRSARERVRSHHAAGPACERLVHALGRLALDRLHV